MNPDRVLTVDEYYDGPRLGVAELNGVPYIYEAEFDHSTDECGDTYFLSPIDPELLALVLEDWAIWCRWDAAHNLSIKLSPARSCCLLRYFFSFFGRHRLSAGSTTSAAQRYGSGVLTL
jgi:hypothetical protein